MVLTKRSAHRSLRDLARVLGISHTTVSQALRNNPRVKLATRERVHKAARKIGYQRNPLASLVMAGMRLKSGHAFRGTLGIIDLDSSKLHSRAAAIYRHEVIKGATERALDLGFRTELLALRQHAGVNIENILQSNGILGGLILPVHDAQTIVSIDWSRYAIVYTDYNDGLPALHNVCFDKLAAIRMALRRLCELGYRRPGLVLEQSEERYLQHRWSAAFFDVECGHVQKTPESIFTVSEGMCLDFALWFQKYKPDVVIAHNVEVMQWMIDQGARVPETHGFCCLNITKKADFNCAGLDWKARLIGIRGIEQVIAQLQRGEYGIPEQPIRMGVSPHWNEGSTLSMLKTHPHVG